MSTSLKLEISEGQIQNAIAVALAESLPPEKRDALVRDVVRAHLTLKTNSYDKETLLSKALGDALRGMAKQALDVELEAMRPKVDALVQEIFGDKFQGDVLDQLKTQLSQVAIKNLKVSVDIFNGDKWDY